MKWFDYFFLVCIVFLGYYVFKYHNEKKELEHKLNSIRSDTTITVLPGIVDTVFIRDTVKIKTVVKIPTNANNLDTVVIDKNHTISISLTDSLLSLNIECDKPIKQITRIDTVLVKEIKYIDKLIPDTRIGWNELAIGFLGGIVTTLIIYNTTK